MSIENILLIISYCLGCFFCIVLSTIDFRNHIPKGQFGYIRIFIFNAFFAIVICFFYVALLHIIVGVTISYKSPYIITTKGIKSLENYRLIAPVLLAFIYVGASKTCITILGKEICLYDRTLHVFLNFLSVPIDQDEVKREIQDKQVDVLQEFINEVSLKSSGFGIREVVDKMDLKKIQIELDRESDRVNFLEEIKSNNKSVLEALEDEKKKLNEVTENYLEKLKLMVKKLIDKNTSNPLFAEFIINFFEITPTKKEKTYGNVMYPLIRSVTMAIIGAIPLSAFFGKFGSDYETLTRITLIAIALFVFLIWFVFFHKLKNNFQNNFSAIFLGIVAGFFGALAFGFIDPDSGFIYKWIIEILNEGHANKFVFTFSDVRQSIHGEQILRGIYYGMISSFIVFFFRYKIVKRFKNLLTTYLIMGFSSFIFTGLILLVWCQFNSQEMSTPLEYWRYIWIDASVVTTLTVVIGLVSNVLHIEKWELQYQEPNHAMVE